MGPEMLETKYPYMCHAELNAIVNCNIANLRGCTMYVTGFPCNECAKLIIQSKIKSVCYLEDPHHDNPLWMAARRLFKLAGVQCKQYIPSRQGIALTYTDGEKSKASAAVSEDAAAPFGTPQRPKAAACVPTVLLTPMASKEVREVSWPLEYEDPRPAAVGWGSVLLTACVSAGATVVITRLAGRL
uniref:dCMP deaminase n=1 Tax=Eutreptiella gymnastica TaxID=73025 RepID=A0A7S1ILZ9_9EUGL|mmetsp:Transcript_27487/g.49515  ORF Transcript_27487/g.49515 Transcript_27487/m.49515 type:complete len:186 (+) Transcript_27487:112-669(+)